MPAEGEQDEVRPYTPISDNSMVGKFQLIIKRYPAWGDPSFPHNYKPPGKMSNYIHNLEIGATVRFKHIPFNIKKPCESPAPALTCGAVPSPGSC
eukprot:2660556-Rhodomonas_salina.1